MRSLVCYNRRVRSVRAAWQARPRSGGLEPQVRHRAGVVPLDPESSTAIATSGRPVVVCQAVATAGLAVDQRARRGRRTARASGVRAAASGVAALPVVSSPRYMSGTTPASPSRSSGAGRRRTRTGTRQGWPAGPAPARPRSPRLSPRRRTLLPGTAGRSVPATAGRGAVSAVRGPRSAVRGH